MKHSIREHIVDPIRGKVVKVSTVNAELGSGILDKNGKEIFEGDKVVAKEVNGKREFDGEITFDDGCFCFLRTPIQVWNDDGYVFEIVGHVDD